jgi:tRNA (guanine37-N1)-methyltransferase
MGVRVGLVESQRLHVIHARFREIAAFEHEVAEIHERRKAALVSCDRIAKIAFRSLRISRAQTADATLGVCLGDAVARRDRRGEERCGLIESTFFERPQAIRVVTQNGESMRIDVVTLFPSFFEPIVNGSILGRAQAKDLVQIVIHDLWKHVPAGERADDTPYGGGPGMVMRLAPLVACMESLVGSGLRVPDQCAVVVPSPAGVHFDHAVAERLSKLERLILVCGHYEGIDERFFDLVHATEISLGDFVLTGGEIAALAFIDATVRLVPSVINPKSLDAESFHSGSLDWPHYTRPAVFRDLAVPEVLLSGDHQRIAAWREAAAQERTRKRRPDIA